MSGYSAIARRFHHPPWGKRHKSGPNTNFSDKLTILENIMLKHCIVFYVLNILLPLGHYFYAELWL